MASVFVSNLDYDVNESDLFDLFGKIGEVRNVKIIKDRESGRSRGFGFVEMATQEEVKAAIEQLHRQEYKGRPLVVDLAKQRQSPIRDPRASGFRS